MVSDYNASMIVGFKSKNVPSGKGIPDLENVSASQRMEWANLNYPGETPLTTSFGAQSAAFLHLATQIKKDIPLLFIDTGYHFPETVEFARELTTKLHLNLQTVRPLLTPQEIEAKHGRLWEMGPEGLEKFHEIVRVEPLQRAMRQIDPRLWVAGLRRTSAASRKKLSVISKNQSRLKLLPILDWNDRQVGEYMRQHSLPYHPLWSQGYVSIGDRVTTRRLDEVEDPAQLRHFGWKRECGIHEKV